MPDRNNGPEIDLVTSPIQSSVSRQNRYDHELTNTSESDQRLSGVNNHLETSNSIVGSISNALSEFNEAREEGLEIIRENGLVNSVVHLGEDIVKNSTEYISDKIDNITGAVSNTIERGVDLVQNAPDMLTYGGVVKTMINGLDTVKETVSNVTDGISKGIRSGVAVGKLVLDISDAVRDNDTNNGYGPENMPHVDQKVLEPMDHFIINDPGVGGKRQFADDYFAKPEDHFTYDVHAVEYGEESDHPESAVYSDGTPKFSGSSTLINPTGDFEKEFINEYGLELYDQAKYVEDINAPNNHITDRPTPLSPLRPFTSTDPKYAHKSIFSSYNRTLLPVADVEFRKGFKHIMISRPECYIMWNGKGLSQQAEYDPDFNSSYTRLPHICELLSPSYIIGGKLSGTESNGIVCNWNYLLSNMISSISGDYKTSISTKEGMTKSIEGHTVLPGGTLESTHGGNLTITFRETKNLEVYECLKLWMLYIHKIRKGIFAPSYNGYQYENSYLGKSTVNANYPMYHPYDRALDYTCSIFENITNESMDKILYWDKWYGCYPIEATLNGIDSSTNAITAPLTVSATFRYQYKSPPCRNMNLIEFNYNAGLVNHIGEPVTQNVSCVANHIVSENLNGVRNYMGPLDLFTGTPYIVLGKESKNLVSHSLKDDVGGLMVPHLRFAHCGDDTINGYTNINLTRSYENTDLLVMSEGRVN